MSLARIGVPCAAASSSVSGIPSTSDGSTNTAALAYSSSQRLAVQEAGQQHARVATGQSAKLPHVVGGERRATRRRPAADPSRADAARTRAAAGPAPSPARAVRRTARTRPGADRAAAASRRPVRARRAGRRRCRCTSVRRPYTGSVVVLAARATRRPSRPARARSSSSRARARRRRAVPTWSAAGPGRAPSARPWPASRPEAAATPGRGRARGSGRCRRGRGSPPSWRPRCARSPRGAWSPVCPMWRSCIPRCRRSGSPVYVRPAVHDDLVADVDQPRARSPRRAARRRRTSRACRAARPSRPAARAGGS